jgi:hypothetical protein
MPDTTGRKGIVARIKDNLFASEPAPSESTEPISTSLTTPPTSPPPADPGPVQPDQALQPLLEQIEELRREVADLRQSKTDQGASQPPVESDGGTPWISYRPADPASETPGVPASQEPDAGTNLSKREKFIRHLKKL